jgi:hypothetical protein
MVSLSNHEGAWRLFADKNFIHTLSTLFILAASPSRGTPIMTVVCGEGPAFRGSG